MNNVARDLGIEGLSPAALIGSGGAANVYACTDTATGQQVAVKILRTNAATDRDRARFETEREVLHRLDGDDRIVEILGSGVTRQAEPYIVMPLMHGSLQDRIDQQGPMHWREAGRLILEIAGAVAHAHEEGILHRDLKPGNVLVDVEGTPRVADFGIAKLAESTGTQSSAAVGTLAFMPPERFAGEPATPSGDIYALGATMAALIGGRAPFITGDNDADVAVMMRVVTDDPPDLSETDGVPDALVELIAECMAKEPADRPSDIGHFSDRLSELLAAQGVSMDAAPVTVKIVSPLAGVHVPGPPAEPEAPPLEVSERATADEPSHAPNQDSRSGSASPTLPFVRSPAPVIRRSPTPVPPKRAKRVGMALAAAAMVAAVVVVAAALSAANGGGDEPEVLADSFERVEAEDKANDAGGSGDTQADGPKTATDDDGGTDDDPYSRTSTTRKAPLTTTSPTSNYGEDSSSTSSDDSLGDSATTGTTLEPNDTNETEQTSEEDWPTLTTGSTGTTTTVASTTTTPTTTTTSTTTSKQTTTTTTTRTTTTAKQTTTTSTINDTTVQRPIGVSVASRGSSRPSNEDVTVAWNHAGDADGFYVLRARDTGTFRWPEDNSLIDGSSRSVDLNNKVQVGMVSYQFTVVAVSKGVEASSAPATFVSKTDPRGPTSG